MKEKPLRILNLRTSADRINASIYSHIFQINNNKFFSESDDEPSKLYDEVCALASYIEKHCTKKKGSPADLPTPSYRIYLWLRFLRQREFFDAHLKTVHELLIALISQEKKIRVDPAYFLIKLDFSGYLYRRHTNAHKTILQINEGFISSPRNIKEDLITAAFSRRSSKQIKKIKSFTSSLDFQRFNQLVSGKPIANHILCRGEKYDLKPLFNKINLEYFQGELPQPRLIWSSRRAVRRLGTYHPQVNTITISKKLDDKKIPRMLVEYVLFHEMLHQSLGVKTQNGRRYAHTAFFKNEEKRFKHYKEAENLIKHL